MLSQDFPLLNFLSPSQSNKASEKGRLYIYSIYQVEEAEEAEAEEVEEEEDGNDKSIEKE